MVVRLFFPTGLPGYQELSAAVEQAYGKYIDFRGGPGNGRASYRCKMPYSAREGGGEIVMFQHGEMHLDVWGCIDARLGQLARILNAELVSPSGIAQVSDKVFDYGRFSIGDECSGQRWRPLCSGALSSRLPRQYPMALRKSRTYLGLPL